MGQLQENNGIFRRYGLATALYYIIQILLSE